MAFGMDITEYRYKLQRDYKNTIDTAFNEGKLEGKLEVAKTAKQMGMTLQDIVKLTGLSEDEINSL
jgi:predicted transposase/invertase (TIGR01784 family)